MVVEILSIYKYPLYHSSNISKHDHLDRCIKTNIYINKYVSSTVYALKK